MSEQVICGFNAIMSALRSRPNDLLRLFFSDTIAPRFGKVCRGMAKERKIYRVCPAEELEKISRTSHHGGAVAFFRDRVIPTADEKVLADWNIKPGLVIALDLVSNPHNIGALVRIAAFFGSCSVLVEESCIPALQSTASTRSAEGGMDALDIYSVHSLPEFLTQYRNQLYICAADTQGTCMLDQAIKKRQQASTTVLILGNEENGLRPDLIATAHDVISIRGCGAIESLNVSQAAAIIIHAFSIFSHKEAKPIYRSNEKSNSNQAQSHAAVDKKRHKFVIRKKNGIQ